MPCSGHSAADTDYPLWDALPEEVINQGKLSQLQLEGVMYACSKHQEILPDGQRERTPSTCVDGKCERSHVLGGRLGCSQHFSEHCAVCRGWHVHRRRSWHR